MKCLWIVENFVKEPSFKELTAALKELNYPLIELNGDYKKSMLDNLPSKCVMANGSIKMMKLMQADLPKDCYPVAYGGLEKYKCSSYYSHFGHYLFNDKYCMMSLKEIVRQKFDVWGHYGKDACIFIRPDSGEKTFQAGILDIMDLPKLHESNKDCEHDLMLVSTPKFIQWEGRFVVSKYKEIITASTYRFQGVITKIPSVPPESTKFCMELLNNVSYVPDSVYCLDIFQDNDGQYWLGELSSFSCAGLYATDKKKLAVRVSEIAEKDWQDNQSLM